MKNRWTWILTTMFVLTATIVSCGKKDAKNTGPKKSPYGPNSFLANAGPYLTTADVNGNASMNIVDQTTYSKFLQEVMGVCRTNSNKGIWFEWNWGSNNCNNASSQFNQFAIDAHLVKDPKSNSQAQIVFFVGTIAGGWGGYGGSNISWIGQMPVAVQYKTTSDGKFRLLTNSTGYPQGPKIELIVKGKITDFPNDSTPVQIDFEYAGKIMATGQIYRLE